MLFTCVCLSVCFNKKSYERTMMKFFYTGEYKIRFWWRCKSQFGIWIPEFFLENSSFTIAIRIDSGE